MKKQQGITLIGMFFVAFLVICGAIAAAKLTPAYVEFWSVKKIFKAMAGDPELKTMSAKQIRESYDRRASIDNVTHLSGKDLEISKDGGETVVEGSYSVKVPLAGNLSAWMDFSVSTQGGKSE